MAICSACGRESRPNDQYCQYCGQPLQGTEMKNMTNDYSGAPQGAIGSGGLAGGAGSGQGAGSWSVQPQYPPYEAQRAFAVAAAPGQSENPPRSAGQDMASGQGNAPSANGTNTSGLGVLIIRPLPSEEGGQTREIVLTGRDVAIGRSPACDVVLEGDQLVSRRHALLRYNGTQYTVVDLGSSNGTYVNEVEIHGNTALHDGDLITIGEHEVLYSARAAAGAGATQAMPAMGQGTGFGAAPAAGPGSFQQMEPAPWSAQPSGEVAPHLAPGSLPASQLFDIAAAQTLMEPRASQGRPEPVWTQPAQPSAGQPVSTQASSAQQPPQSALPPIEAEAQAYPQPPSPYEQVPAQPTAYPYPQQPSSAPASSSASTPNQPQGVSQSASQGRPSGGLFMPPSFVPPSQGGSTSSIRNTSASLRAVRAQLDEANQRLAQAEEEESRLAEQRNAALVEVRDRLNAILGEQGRNANVGYGAGMYGTVASPNANPNLNSLISLARQTAENPRHIDYMMQLAAHAGEIASALENAQSTAPSRSGNTGLLAQLDGLRARLDELIS